jgi:Regulator of chromosome condensation (RCC1) repeat
MSSARPTLHATLAALVAGALLGACGDTLVDHSNTGVRDSQQPTTCDVDQVDCGGVCKSQDPTKPGYVCGTSCTPCGTPPANSAVTCTPVGPGGHDGFCGFDCNPGLLKTSTGCSAPTLVAGGGQFSCATAADTGEVHCWGANDQSQLGPGVAGTFRATSRKVQSSALVGVTALAAGPGHACAVVGATVYCWGDATGWGGTAISASPTVVPALAGVATLAAGARHTCGITAAGALQCAGADADGGGSPTLGGTVLEVAAGDSFSCALLGGATPAVKCWGVNDHGQSNGSGTTTPAVVPGSSPATIPLTPAVGLVLTHVAAGSTHACATTSGSTPTDPVIFCWGDDTSHQLGKNGTGASASGPTSSEMNKPIATVGAPTVIDAGGITTCAVKDDGANFLQCWGGDPFADGGTPAAPGELVDLTTLDPPGAFSVGGDHGCIVDPTGKLASWGRGGQGQLGNGAVADSAGPVLVIDR